MTSPEYIEFLKSEIHYRDKRISQLERQIVYRTRGFNIARLIHRNENECRQIIDRLSSLDKATLDRLIELLDNKLPWGRGITA